MNSNAIEFVGILSAIEKVIDSKLFTDDEKGQILGEMVSQVPADFFCASCPRSRQIIESLLLEKSNALKKPKKTPKRTTKTKKSEHGEGQLF